MPVPRPAQESVVVAHLPCAVNCDKPAAELQATLDGLVVRHLYSDQSVYEGAFLAGKRHGHGTLTLADGTKYDANWVNDKRHGEGSELFADGSHFVGTYVDGFRSGHGVMTWPEGSKYSGQFARGRANGKGHLLRTDGSVYKGYFHEDSMCGEGCMQWMDGVEYVGQFVANRREGHGRIKWVGGRWRSYGGEWKDGMQHGEGALTDHNGNVHTGLFRCGKLVQWHLESPQAAGVVEVPHYWHNCYISDGFSERRDVPDELQQEIQKLLDGTFQGVRTRDRSGQLPSRLRLVKCHRVENSAMWSRYQKAKVGLAKRRPSGVTPVAELGVGDQKRAVRTTELLQDGCLGGCLDDHLNELYLWHGTTPEGAIGISTSGFRLTLAGTRAGTFFGKGCYFAECSSKSDEYAREGDSILAGIYALLLCRVLCGNLFRVTRPDHAAIRAALDSEKYDSVLGDREASVGTYREFVVYNEACIYPEYVVLYERKFDALPQEDQP